MLKINLRIIFSAVYLTLSPFADVVLATQNMNLREATKKITGTVLKTTNTRILIEKEGDKEKVNLRYMHPNIENFKSGDKVRAYYERPSKLIVSIQKLTELEFSPSDQNLGYIVGQPNPKSK